MNQNGKQRVLTGLLVASICASVCTAFLRNNYSDAQVVSRSETIVVGRIKDGSIKFVPLPGREGEGTAWVHHAELLIEETLKGHTISTSIVVRISYGLYPITGGVASNQFTTVDVRMGNTNYPKDFVAIFDTGNSLLTFDPVTGDIRSNHVWFLRHESGSYGNTNLFGVFDPEDIKSVSTKQEIMKLIEDRAPNTRSEATR